ncbi:branched-chain amino acid ABC transporter permease [Candidatus Leptofilum sp.]|uniref:branched-chain amino acid ABC transporter permease n=1 Tax=Candidatus Leptofilum sp. TaxID=3241576 RepID=UPI003B5B8C66
MNEQLRKTVNLGLIAGVVALSLGMIGIIDAFNQRFVVTDVVTLGQLLLFGMPLVAGFLVASRFENGSVGSKLLHGGLAGILTNIPIFGLLLITLVWETIRNSFINVKPDLIAIFTFNNENVVVGGLLLMLAFVGLGVAGVGVSLLPTRFRRPLFMSLAWSVGSGVMSDILIGILRPRLSNDALRSLFGSTGLERVPFVVLFVVLTAVFFWWQQSGQNRYQAVRQNFTPQQQKNSRRVSISLLVIFLLILPSLLGVYLSEIFNEVGRFILMGLGLNIAIGLAGLLDLGYVTNFAVGAYIMALLTSNSDFGVAEPWSFWLAVPICVVAAMFTGFVLALPVLKMRGDYLAIATLGFGEIIRVLARSDALKPFIGGAQGILQIPSAKIGGFLAQAMGVVLDPINNFLGRFELGILATNGEGEIIFGNPPQLYYLFILASLLMLFVSRRLNNSRTGRRWMAIREDEDVAAAMGINTTNAKVLAFTLSAASGGLAGAIFAAKLGSIFPTSFELLISVNVLSLIIVGGLGSIPGVIVGAFALVGIPQLLSEFAEFRLLLYGIALIVMMLVRPEGLWPSEVHRREIQGDGEDDTAVPVTAKS